MIALVAATVPAFLHFVDPDELRFVSGLGLLFVLEIVVPATIAVLVIKLITDKK